MLIIPLIIGFTCVLFSLLEPKIGYFLTILFSFFISDLERLVHIDSLSFIIDILIFVTFIGILINKLIIRDRFWSFSNHAIVYVYGLYFIYTLIQIFNPNVENFGGTIMMIRKWFILLLFFYCSIQLFKTEQIVINFLKLWLILAFIVALYGCWETWFGMPQYHLDFIYSSELRTGLYKLDNGDFRKFSFLGDPKEYGLLLAASAIIPIVFLVYGNFKFKMMIISVIVIAILILGMSYSGTRTANFMLVIGLFFFILMTLANAKAILFLSILALGLVFILYAPIYGNVTINRLRSTVEVKSDPSLLVRDKNRKKIQPYILSHPIGGGLGSTGVLNAKNNPNHELRGFPPDSGFLQTALETGWIGLLIQCCVYLTIILSGIKAFFSLKIKRNKNLILISTSVIFSYVAAHYSQVAIGDVPGIFLFYGLASLIIRIPQIEKSFLNDLI